MNRFFWPVFMVASIAVISLVWFFMRESADRLYERQMARPNITMVNHTWEWIPKYDWRNHCRVGTLEGDVKAFQKAHFELIVVEVDIDAVSKESGKEIPESAEIITKRRPADPPITWNRFP